MLDCVSWINFYSVLKWYFIYLIRLLVHFSFTVPVSVETVPKHPEHVVGSLTRRRHHHEHDQTDDRSPRATDSSHEQRRR